jgi:hypothetical protein
MKNDEAKKLNFSPCIETLKKYRKEIVSLDDLILEIEKIIPDDQLLTLLRKL